MTFGIELVRRRAAKSGSRPCPTPSPRRRRSTVKVNTVDHNTFQENINTYLQGTPDDVFTWFAGYRMRYFAEKGLVADISDVWANVRA